MAPAPTCSSAASFAGLAVARELAATLQRLVPALPPRVLTLALSALSARSLVDRAFGWYLDQAHPDHATLGLSRAPSRRRGPRG